MRRIDLNADLGEGVTDDVGLLEVVTSANLACGYHAGDVATMAAVCAGAAAIGVVIGAQVSYADRAHFGRVPQDVSVQVLTDQIADQVGTLSEIAHANGTTVGYLKPHGALYHRTIADSDQAGAVLAGSGDLAVLTMPGELNSQARAAGRQVYAEGFPDRGYDADGLLLDRSLPGAVLTDTDQIVAHALGLAAEVDSLCLHGDTPGAVQHARRVRSALERAGWTLTSFLGH